MARDSGLERWPRRDRRRTLQRGAMGCSVSLGQILQSLAGVPQRQEEVNLRPMKMRSMLSVLVFLLPACRASDGAAVNTALEEYRQAWLQGDSAMALRRLSGDVRFLFPGTPDLDSAAVHALVIDEMAKYTIPSLT